MFRRSIENNRNNPLAYFLLAAALANLGKLEEAQCRSQGRPGVDPGFSIRRFRKGERERGGRSSTPCARPECREG